MKLTKIVATIGPACDSEEMIEGLLQAGVNVFRFNFKHNEIEWHSKRIQRVNTVAKKLCLSVGTLIDLQGPEIRIHMPTDQIEYVKGERLVFGQEIFQSKEKGFSVSHPQIIPHLREGQELLAQDGQLRFVIHKEKNITWAIPDHSGILKNKKNFHIPGADYPLPVLIDRDFEGLKLAAINEIDYVALSFVRSADDIRMIKKEMKKYHVKAQVIAKIEAKKALIHLDEIINESDGIMVARGDLGVEIPISEVPYYQKMIIKKSIIKGKPVITATQMLETMMVNSFPTRAEVSDVANATYDLTDAVMLSGETAAGLHPQEAVKIMSDTVKFNETKNLVDSRLRFQFQITSIEGSVCEAAYGLYRQLKEIKSQNLAGFIVFTQTGKTAQLISRYRPLVPIFAFAHTKKVADSLTVSFGILPFYHTVAPHNEVTKIEISQAVEVLLEKKLIKSKQSLIVLHGDNWAEANSTSTVKIVQVI